MNQVKLTDKIKSIGQMAWRYLIGVPGLRQNDIWLASFPRAGNTWVRFILCNMISLSEMGGRRVDFQLLDATMPALGYSNLIEHWQFRTVPRFVKTHLTYQRVLFSLPARTVYVLRDPRDVMVSYYHFSRANKLRPFDGCFAEFIRDSRYGLRACIKHYLSWRPHATSVVQFEALKKDTVTELHRMLIMLQIQVPVTLVQTAVDLSCFDRIRLVEEKRGLSGPLRFRQQFRFVRKGDTEQWRDYFSESDLVFYEQVSRELGFDLYF